MSRRIGLWLAALSMLWCVVIWTSSNLIPVGLLISDVSDACAVSIDADGIAMKGGAKDICIGKNRMSVPRNASSFRFVFHSSKDSVCIGLRGITIWGCEVLPAELITHFDMRPRLYTAIPQKGEPLRLIVRNGDTLDLPNVFPVAVRIARMSSYAVALFPIVTLLMSLCVWSFCGKLLLVADRALSRPFAFAILSAIVLLLTLPNPLTPSGPGLDPSWVWLINRYAFTGAIGRDFVFTYGPLGFLISPQLTAVNMVCGIFFNITFSLMFLFELWWLYKGSCNTMERLPVYMLLFCWLLPSPNGMEWKWCLVSVTAAAISLFACGRSPRMGVLFLTIAALSAVLQSFIKFSNCISVVFQQILLLVVVLVSDRRMFCRSFFVYVSVLLISAFLGAEFLFPSWTDFFSWFRGSVEITSGYNTYMGTDKPLVELMIPFVVIAATFVSCILVVRHSLLNILCWLAFSVLLFCSYKYAVVRQTSMPLMFVVIWVALLISRLSDRYRLQGVFLAIVVCVIMYGTRTVLYGSRTFTCASVRNIVRICRPYSTLDECRRLQFESFAKYRIPQEWLERIGTNRIMIVGSEMGAAMSGELNLVPFPATQDYSAYTPYLEQLCIKRLADSTNLVDYVLLQSNPQSFDSRNICFDNLRLWCFLRRHYMAMASDEHYVLLARRTDSVQCICSEENFSCHQKLSEKLKTLFWRAPRCMACIRFDDGTERLYSANVRVLDGASIPLILPRKDGEVAAMFVSEGGLPKVENVKILAP